MSKRLSLICLVMLVAACNLALATEQGKPINGEQAFAKMKTLVGRWEATTTQGKKAVLNVEMVSSNTALLERFVVEGEENMVTLYHLDRGHLMLTHYCAANNQPRMRAVSYSPESGTLQFAFLDATNLASPNDGHMHRAVFKFVDDNNFTTEWTFRKDQKDTFTEELRYTRKQ